MTLKAKFGEYVAFDGLDSLGSKFELPGVLHVPVCLSFRCIVLGNFLRVGPLMRIE